MLYANRKFFLIIFFLILYAPVSYNQQKLSSAEKDSIIKKGKSEIINRKWGDVIDTFGDLLDADPDNILANYYYAIAQREDGVTKNPVERIIRWNAAERHFKKVIETDSTFLDTFYQYAVLESYRDEYIEAAQLARHQMEINNLQEQAALGIFHIYDVMLANGNSDDVENYLKPEKSAYDKYFLGEYYRRNDNLDKAIVIFDQLIADKPNIPLIPVYLSLVRLYIQQNKFEEADKTYWTAVDTATNKVEAALLLKDFELILNGREYKIINSSLPLTQLKKVMRIFWLEKNPLPSLPYNIRLIEHYRRLMYAEKYYRFDGFRLSIYDANKLDLIRHPPWYYLNDDFNDMGYIYIRFGKPDEISTTLQGLSNAPPDRSGVLPSNGQPNMAWLYRETNRHPRMVFYFLIDKDAPPGYWTLVPMILDPEVLKDLYTWDPRYYDVNPLYRDTWNKLATEGVKTAELGLTTDSFKWPKEIKPLEANFAVNQFRENENSNLFSLDYAVPLNELSTELNDKDSLLIKVDVSVYDSTMNLLLKKDNNFRLTSHDKHIYNSLFINSDKFLLKRQKYIVSMDIRIPSENKLFGSYFDYNLTDFNDSLSCSSLEQAFKITPNNGTENRDKDNSTIIPNPSLKFDKSENVFTYYEIYNLSYDNDERTNYSVSFDIQRKDKSKSIWDFFTGLFGKSDVYNLSIQNNYNGNTKNVSNYLAFDISELKSGDYKITLTVKDNVSSKGTSTSSDLIIK